MHPHTAHLCSVSSVYFIIEVGGGEQLHVYQPLLLFFLFLFFWVRVGGGRRVGGSSFAVFIIAIMFYVQYMDCITSILII